MPKILHNGKQYTITINPDLIKAMGWKKGTELILSKIPGEKTVYIEEIKSNKKKSKK